MSDKKKYYLRGLSIGMIFTCLVLMIVFNNNKPSLSDKEFAAEAEKRGYVLKEEANTKPTTAINMEDLKKTPSPTPSQAVTDTPTPEPSNTATPSPEPTLTNTLSPTPTVTVEPIATPTTAPTSTPTATPTAIPTATPTVTPMATPGPDTTEMVVATITVAPGSTSEMVTNLLYQAKIIKNTADFNRFVYENKVANCFQVGVFEVNDKMSYKDLIYVLSRGTVALP